MPFGADFAWRRSASRSGHLRHGRGSCGSPGRRNDHGADRAGSRRRTSGDQLRVADRVDPALYSVKNDRLGMTFSPAKRASPSSRTPLMTWRWRAVPNSFKAKSDRRVQPGGIISDPGNPAAWRMRSRGIEARMGRKRNRPPNWVSNERGLRSSCRTSATSAVVGRELGPSENYPLSRTASRTLVILSIVSILLCGVSRTFLEFN